MERDKISHSRWMRSCAIFATAFVLLLYGGCGGGSPVTAPASRERKNPVTISLVATPAAVTAGQQSRLTWTVANASSVLIDNEIGPVTASGWIGVSPAATTTYTLTATGTSGTSTATAVVSVLPLANDGLNSHFVTLNWTASTSMNVVGYYIYRGTQSGGPYTKQNPIVVATTTYTDSDVVAGTTYYYVATTVNSSGQESEYSAEASATVPSP